MRLVRLLIVQGMLTERMVNINNSLKVYWGVEPTSKGMIFLEEIQLKKVKVEEIEELKFAFVDYSSNNICEENINNIGSKKNRDNKEFFNLVESESYFIK
jgi:hypothetical protein